MAGRSKPAVVALVPNRTGSTSYRVTCSIRGKQRKRVFLSLDDAEACRQLWEVERLQGAAAARPKFTWLTNDQLRQCEAMIELLKGVNMSPVDLAKHFLKNPPFVAPTITWKDGLAAFLREQTAHLSTAHIANCEIRARNFGRFVGDQTPLTAINAERVAKWLGSKGIGKKTWNNYRGDLSAIFEWFAAKPRQWIAENPAAHVESFKRRSMPAPARERLEVSQCRELMAYLEENKPHWCTFFAVTLFAGVRPDMRNGEMHELARCVERDGIARYYHDGIILELTEEIAKTNGARETTVHENLAHWLERYPPTPKSLCPGDYKEYIAIRERFRIPHDGLRHTAISAHVAKYGNLALSSQEFGNSEGVIRRNYNRRMSPSDAESFYRILPKAARTQIEQPKMATLVAP